ncbi:hypothetical protein C9926_01730 [Sulfurovum lithotrophicum]|nr:hypothetical protein C9926_01730 [Sulfurovum lithotrophicum]
MKKLLILLGALALSFTLATAEGKCESGKCNGDMNKTEKKCNASNKDVKKCNGAKGSSDKKETKEAPAKGKCGQGKCG